VVAWHRRPTTRHVVGNAAASSQEGHLR
jgi:hypothetical protein